VERDPDHSPPSRTEAKKTNYTCTPTCLFWCGQGQLYLRKVPVGTIISLIQTNTDYLLPHIILQITVTDISDFLVKILPSLVTPPAYIKHLNHKHISY